MRSDVSLPQGTVTFLFADIEGSTRLLQKLGDLYANVLAEHRRTLARGIRSPRWREVGTEGDSFFLAFAKASDALAGCDRFAPQVLHDLSSD